MSQATELENQMGSSQLSQRELYLKNLEIIKEYQKTNKMKGGQFKDKSKEKKTEKAKTVTKKISVERNIKRIKQVVFN